MKKFKNSVGDYVTLSISYINYLIRAYEKGKYLAPDERKDLQLILDSKN